MFIGRAIAQKTKYPYLFLASLCIQIKENGVTVMSMFRYSMLLLVCSAVCFFACSDEDVNGSGNTVIVDLTENPISGLTVDDGISVDWQVRREDTTLVLVEIDDNSLGYLNAIYDGPTLILGLESNGRALQNITCKATVVTKHLRDIIARNSSIISLVVEGKDREEDIREDVNCDVNTGSTLGGVMYFDSLRMNVADNSTVVLGGSGYKANIVVSNGSMCELSDMQVGDCSVTASDGSTVYVYITGNLDVHVTGGSRVYYLGEPQIGIDFVEDGSVFERLRN